MSKVNVEDEEASERCRTSPSWKGMKRDLEVSQNSAVVKGLTDADSGRSQNAALKGLRHPSKVRYEQLIEHGRRRVCR